LKETNELDVVYGTYHAIITNASSIATPVQFFERQRTTERFIGPVIIEKSQLVFDIP
jgi:hypothetical protein